MAKLVWAEPALADLDAIADYIALDNPDAAARLVQRVFDHVTQLKIHPESGSKLPELERSRYRHIIEPPCRIIYRYDGRSVYIVHVMRSERLLRPSLLSSRLKETKK